MTFEFKLSVPKDAAIVDVRLTDGRGFTPEELAEQLIHKESFHSDGKVYLTDIL